MEHADIGVIGGSGFYAMPELQDVRAIELKTPFGQPSEKIMLGTLNGRRIAFLSRHGVGHRLNPSEVNYRANLYAMKMLGVSHLLSIAAVGSLKEELRPTDLVIPDQFYDNTWKREKTYFEKGAVAHVSMAEPFCPALAQLACDQARALGLVVHKGGTYINMEGPQFSSRGESNAYRQMGFAIIGMTQAVEAKLARELEMCFVPLAFVTDYDCWHAEAAAVTVDIVIQNLNKNIDNAKKLIHQMTALIAAERSACACGSSLQTALITDPHLIPKKTYRNLQLLIGKYTKEKA